MEKPFFEHFTKPQSLKETAMHPPCREAVLSVTCTGVGGEQAVTSQGWVEKGGFYLDLLSVVTAAESWFCLLELKIHGEKIMCVYIYICIDRYIYVYIYIYIERKIYIYKLLLYIHRFILFIYLYL